MGIKCPHRGLRFLMLFFNTWKSSSLRLHMISVLSLLLYFEENKEILFPIFFFPINSEKCRWCESSFTEEQIISIVTLLNKGKLINGNELMSISFGCPHFYDLLTRRWNNEKCLPNISSLSISFVYTPKIYWRGLILFLSRIMFPFTSNERIIILVQSTETLETRRT